MTNKALAKNVKKSLLRLLNELDVDVIAGNSEHISLFKKNAAELGVWAKDIKAVAPDSGAVKELTTWAVIVAGGTNM